MATVHKVATTQPYDLREFFHALGSYSPSRALTASPEVRLQCDVPVELLDTESSLVVSPPLKVKSFVDGIQHALCIMFREHRPIFLTFVAAGAGSNDGRLLAVRESMNVVLSHLDAEWLSTVNTSIPSIQLSDERPDEISAAALATLAGSRETLERVLVQELIASDPAFVVVDGNLVGRPVTNQVVGVVKTSQRKYLPDESILWRLPVRWRSPRFLMPQGSQGVKVPRYSCYVRLHDASRQAWNFGLIRLEAFDPDLLDPLAALAFQERQPVGAHDARFDRHLSGVRAVEDLLRARRPPVF